MAEKQKHFKQSPIQTKINRRKKKRKEKNTITLTLTLTIIITMAMATPSTHKAINTHNGVGQ